MQTTQQICASILKLIPGIPVPTQLYKGHTSNKTKTEPLTNSLGGNRFRLGPGDPKGNAKLLSVLMSVGHTYPSTGYIKDEVQTEDTRYCPGGLDKHKENSAP